MGSEDTATIGSPAPAAGGDHSRPAPSSSAADLAARAAQQLTASQARLPGSVMRPGAPRPTAPRGAIHDGILDHMVTAQSELVEHARAVPSGQMTRPAPRETAALYRWLGEHTPFLDEGARLAGEAMMYRQHMEHRLRAGDVAAVRQERCLTCQCFSLHWAGTLEAAVCMNMRCAGADGRPSRFTLQQLAAKAVENLTVRAAT
jgi:hypothetical protein